MENNPETDDPHGTDWHNDNMDFKPGRFYHAMGFIHVPCMGEFGGDVLCLIWRYEDEPNIWNVTMRFRYYAGENNPAFDGKDIKKWYVYRKRECDDVSRMRGEFELITSIVSIEMGEKPEPMDWIIIDGNFKHASMVMTTTERPWLHKRSEPIDVTQN